MRGYIRRRSKGSWTVEVSRGFDAATGKRQRVYRTVTGSKRDAEAALARLLTELENGTDVNPAKVTLSEYVAKWLEHMRGRVRPRTWERYEGLLRVHLVKRIGHVPLSKLRPAHIQGVLDEMLSEGLSPRSTIHLYRVLGSSLRQARRWQLIATNPVEAVSPPRAPRPKLHIPNAEELRRLLHHAENSPARIGILLAVATGLRRGELLGLTWRDVAIETGRISVTSTLQRVRAPDGSSSLQSVDPKTPRARRSVVLPPFAVDALRAYRKEQAERRLRLGDAWTDLDLVLDRSDGRPYDPAEFSKAFRVVADSAGLPSTRLHDVRHGFATALLISGVHPKIASEALGHSSVAFTLDTYSHVLPGLQEATARALEEILCAHSPNSVNSQAK